MTISTGGVFPVLPTIFDAQGKIDETGFKRVIEFVVDSGVDGVVFPGLASEVDQLTLDEKLRLTRIVGGAVRGRCAFVVGASGATDAETRTMITAGGDVGATAAMIMTPARFAGDLEGLIAFYRGVGQGAAPEIMLQNAPPPMGSGLLPDDVARLLQAVPLVRYVKEENMPCGHRITALLSDPAPSLRGVFGGAGGRYITDELARGSIGTMPASELPEISVALMAAFRADDWDSVRSLHERMLPVLMMQAIFRWDLTKAVLRRRGLIEHPFVRAPGPRLDHDDLDELDRLLHRIDDLTGMLAPARAAIPA